MSVMFGLDFGEMLLLAAIALIALGPKQLPEVARTLGKFLNEIKRLTGDFTKTVVDARDQTNEKLTAEQEAELRKKDPTRFAPANHHTTLVLPDSAAQQIVPASTSETNSEDQLSFDLKKDSQ